MKIYLAAKFERKMEMRNVRDFLVSEGHEVTSQWIDVEHTRDHNVQVTDEMRVGLAEMDIADVLRADVLVAFAHPRSEPSIGGGRHVEFGVALQAGKKIIVVGPKGEHIFHYWPGVLFVDDVDALATLLHFLEDTRTLTGTLMIEIVLGPPGTGKTTTLLGEVEKELARGIAPDRIAYVTFTKKGATVAVERARKRFKLQAAQLPHFRTLHSLCYRALQVSSGDMLVGKAFFEFADYAGIDVTGRAWSDDGLLTSFKQGDRALFMENLARIRMVPLRQQYDENWDGLNWNYVSRVSTALTNFKMSRGLLDYTDMLSQFVAEDRDVGVQKLFVDEAQDLSPLQWAVVNLLGRSADRIVIAGDDDQAIYRWAGADVEHLITMRGKVRVLNQSFRCPLDIQTLSNRVISRVKHRRPKKWSARIGDSGVVEDSPGFGIVDIADKGSVLVLARNAYVLRESVEPVLRAEGIVYELAGKSSIDPDMVIAASAWEDLEQGEPIPLGDARRMYKFMAVNKSVKKGYKTLPKYGDDDDEPVTMTDLIMTGGLLVAPEKIWHDALDRLPVEDMSYMLAARRRGERLRGGKPRVRLSTIHSAKGGEADHVVLMKQMAPRTYEEMHVNPDDERRCWYVGITRAKQRLTVVESVSRMGCPWI